jgi:hypothetical protein
MRRLLSSVLLIAAAGCGKALDEFSNRTAQPANVQQDSPVLTPADQQPGETVIPQQSFGIQTGTN